MSKAMRIDQWDREKFRWFDVEDSDGKTWRYEKGNDFECTKPDCIDVVARHVKGAAFYEFVTLEPGLERQPRLSQEDDGLPNEAFVRIIRDYEDNHAKGSEWFHDWVFNRRDV